MNVMFGVNAWFEQCDPAAPSSTAPAHLPALRFQPTKLQANATHVLTLDVATVPYGARNAMVATWYAGGLDATAREWQEETQAHRLTVRLEERDGLLLAGPAEVSVEVRPEQWRTAAQDPIAAQEEGSWIRAFGEDYQHPGDPLARLRADPDAPFVVARFRFLVRTADLDGQASLRVQIVGDGEVLDETPLLADEQRLELPWGAGPPQAAAMAPPAAEERARTVQVFYATDRKNTGARAPYERYSGEYGVLETGVLEVSIPPGHEEGEIERPHFGWHWLESRARHVMLLSVDTQDPEAFYAGLARGVAGTSRREAFVFIHGYNVTFEAAALRAGQMAYDLERLGLDAAPVLYSWPSLGTTAGYAADLDAAEWSAGHLAGFLQEVRDRSGADLVHLIAHSMGNRVLTLALRDLARRVPGETLFHEVVLAAPDVDADVFRQVAAEIRGATRRMTLYANSHDLALDASQALRRGRVRAGDVEDGVIVVVPGVESVDASDLDTGFMGHSYFAEEQLVLRDVAMVLGRSAPPAARPWLQGREDGARHWWAFAGKR